MPSLSSSLALLLAGLAGFAHPQSQWKPSRNVEVIVTEVVKNAFIYNHMGYASAMAWVLFIFIMMLTILQFRLSRRWVYYEGGE